MKKKTLMNYFAATIAATSLLWLGPATYAQSEQAQDRSRAESSDITRDKLARFDQFLDSHREIAEQLRKNPSLVNDSSFVQQHQALQTYLQQHPAVREELKENPNAFMRQEDRFDDREAARDRRDNDPNGNRDDDRDVARNDDRDRFDNRNRDADARAR